MAERARVAGILSLCLLLLSSIGATGALASAAPPRTAAPHAAAIVIGTNSCQGTDACTDAVGPIGNNSCNGAAACEVTLGSIGDDSCNGPTACLDSVGPMGNNSCNENSACAFSEGSIGDGSCNAADACYQFIGSIGNYSCNGDGACDTITDNIGDCANNTVTPPICEVQPDARVRRAGGPLVGNDIYNGDGLDQSVTTAAGADKYRRFYISIQNDDLVTSDSFRVTEFPAGPLAGFVYRYFKGNSNREITAAILGGTFTTPVLAPGEKYQIRVRVYIGPSASTGSTLTRLLQATSVANSTKLDVVGYSVRRR